jgi:arsenate reductase
MAEGWARHLHEERIEASSAGIEKHGLNEHAVAVMAEAGIDISMQHSKTIEDLGEERFDYVITVCDHAHESCPLFPGSTTVVHVGFPDPPRLAEEIVRQGGDKQQILDCYRRVRDEIKDFIKTLPDSLFP